MTRKLLTDFNSRPYFDDFDETKNFLRVLFKPGTALQAREITQLQTIINEQIHRFGNHIFKDGSGVLEGSFNVDVNVKYIKLHDTHNEVDVSSYLDELEGRILTDNSSSNPIRFKVRKVVKNTSSEPNTLIGVYLSGETEVSANGNQVLITEQESGLTSRSVTTAKIGQTINVPTGPIKGSSSIASVNDGVFYISGFFHRVDNQTIVLDKYSNKPTNRIGLEVQEEIITSGDDQSLYDNAQGSSNFSAPGADRFKITLLLKSKQLDSESGNIITNNASCDFYEFVRVRNGQKVDQIRNPQYSYLGEQLARRTYDANGDFIVSNFNLDIDNHGDSEKLKVILDSGKAYVKGYEIETIAPVILEMEKGRDTNEVLSENINSFLGNYVYVTFPTGATFPDISKNPKIDVWGDDSDTEKMGTCRIKQLNYDPSVGEDDNGISGSYALSFFDLQLNEGRSTKEIRSFRNSDDLKVFEVSGESINSDTETIISQQGRGSLLFDLEKSSIESVSKLKFFANNVTTGFPKLDPTTGNTQTKLNLTVSDTDSEQFLGFSPDVTYPQQLLRQNFIFIDKSDGTNYNNFSHIDVVSNSEINFYFNDTSMDGAEVYVFYKVQVTKKNQRNKTLKTEILDLTSAGDVINMEKVGVPVSLRPYYDIQSVKIFQSDGVEITEIYELDNGQRDSFYDFGSIKLKTGVTVPSSSSYSIEIQYYDHPLGNDIGFFTKDSYPEGLNLENSPVYTSKNTGKSYNLFDVIDFRPTVNSDGDTVFGSRIPYGAMSDFLEVDYNYYLPRIDKIVLTKDKEFRVIKGVSSDFPKTPPDDPNAMSLYILTVPPYTYNSNDLKVIPIHNRRYTMKDIGILDRRIEELQARSNLKLLQERTKNVQIRNSNDVDIFKNGILIDDFSGHSVGDVTSRDYRCSIDFETQELRPSFKSYSHDLTFDSSNSENIIKKGPLLLMNYSEVSHLEQPMSSKSINVNPHQMAYWFGDIKMDPSSDMWFSQNLKPRVNINDGGENNAWENLSESVSVEFSEGFGTQWNDWEDIWTGKENFLSNEEFDPSFLLQTSSVRSGNKETTNYLFDAADKIGSVSAGLPNRMEKEMTNKKVDNSVIPFIRSKQVNFVATNLIPNGTFHAFFDGENVTENISLCTKITFTDSSKAFIDGIYDGEIISGPAGSAKVIKNVNDGTGSVYVNILNGSFTSGDSVSGNGVNAIVDVIHSPTELISDSAGQICGTFTIPSEESKKFRTGKRLFRLINNSNNNLNPTDGSTLSLAEFAYCSQGLMEDPENTVVSTRTPISKRSNMCDELSISKDVFSRESQTPTRCLDWKDPLSQTFIVDFAAHRNGIFLSSVDLFFKSKDNSLPIMIEIRPTVNGYPSTSTVIPFSEVVLNSSQVNVSNGPDPLSSSSKTTFTFDAPVYLSPGEYSICVKTNGLDYELWAGVVGESRLDETTGIFNIALENVANQPLVGNLYTSHNSGNWEKLNNNVLMFKLNRCKFNTIQSKISMNVNSPSEPEEFSLFKYNVSMLNNFYETLNPKFKYQIGDGTLTSFHENRNIEFSSLKSFSENSPLKISAEISVLPDQNSDVCPVLDLERMSLITVENIVDNIEYDTSDLTIESGGDNYSPDDKLVITDANDPSKVTKFNLQVDAGEDGRGPIIGFNDPLISSSNMSGDVTVSIEHFDSDPANQGSNHSIIVDGETKSSGSVADAVYISKRVNLKSPYESKDIRVYLDLYKPSGTNVSVYYKVASTNDTVIFEDRKWYLMSQITPEYVVSEYSNDYREYVFGTNGGTEPTKSEIENFNIYAIKIVLSSSNKAKTPKARNLRAIALQEPAGV